MLDQRTAFQNLVPTLPTIQPSHRVTSSKAIYHTSAVPVGSMYSYRKMGGYVAFSWPNEAVLEGGTSFDCFWQLSTLPLYFTAKLFTLPCLVSLFSAQPHVWLYSYFFILRYCINTMDLLFSKCVNFKNSCTKLYVIIYIYMQAMPQAQAYLSSPLPAQHSAGSSLFWLTTQKRLPYTLNTLHQTLHNTLTIHIKHAICHKFPNSQNSLSLSLSITFTAAVTLPPPSPATMSSVPQQPNHVVCHIILWVVGTVPFSTKRSVFSCLQTLPVCGHFCDKSPFLPFLPAGTV